MSARRIRKARQRRREAPMPAAEETGIMPLDQEWAELAWEAMTSGIGKEAFSLQLEAIRTGLLR